MRGAYFCSRLNQYFVLRESDDNTSIAVQDLLKKNDGKNKSALKRKIDLLQEDATKYDQGKTKSFKKGRANLNRYLPTIIMFVSRVCMFVLVYMYHTNNSFMNLSWIIFSFITPPEWTFFLSCWFMIPLLTWQFLFTYGVRIPVLKDTAIF